MRPERAVHSILGHGEDDDLVVGEQVSLNGAGEGQAVELWAVGVLLVHGEDVHVVPRRLGLRTLGVDARGGSHVEPPARAYALTVVHEDEGRGVVAGAVHPGSTVSLVAEDEVEGRGSRLLRTSRRWEASGTY